MSSRVAASASARAEIIEYTTPWAPIGSSRPVSARSTCEGRTKAVIPASSAATILFWASSRPVAVCSQSTITASTP
jgi:hypothetical protein